MWWQFFLEDFHFAVNFFAGLVFFAIFWLHYDAWMARKARREIPKLIGLFLLSLSYVFQASTIETSLIPHAFLGDNVLNFLVAFTRVPGYVLIILSLWFDPLLPRPKTGELSADFFKSAFLLPIVTPLLSIAAALEPILAAGAGFFYLRRSTLGLEKHLRPVAFGFFILSLSSLWALAGLFTDTSNVTLYNLVAPLGAFWILEHLTLFAGCLFLGRWVWRYLLKRFQSQLFIIFTALSLAIFLITTISFTALLLRHLELETLNRLKTDVKVLQFAVDSKKAETLSDAQALAQNSQIQTAVTEKNLIALSPIVQNFLASKKESFLVVVNDQGQVLARGEDAERIGDSLSEDPLIRRALLGQAQSTIAVTDGVLAPAVSVRSAVPIKGGEQVLGAVMTGVIIDNAFVDGIKQATGLEAAIYGDNVLSATTLVAADGKSRWVGTKEENDKITSPVLLGRESYAGGITLLNTPYFAAYQPLKDINEAAVGMLFVGTPQIDVLRAAGRSIELTFLMATLLILLSVIPAHMISRYIAYQLQ